MSEIHGRLKSLLKQESSALEELYTVLMKELVALKEHDSESVIVLSEEKNTLLTELEKLDKDRQFCVQANSSSENLIFKDDINQLSTEIEVCLNKCKQQNSINGGIIEMSRLFNEKMLDIICGNTANETTYGSTGKNNTNSNQHSLGRV
jgi:flagella synthesis protein FlgN